METELRALLKNTYNAIDEIDAFVQGISNFTDFQNDLKTKRAVERNVQIIGRAISLILKKEPSMVFSGAEEFIAIRKKLIKVRETTFDQTLWGLIRRRTVNISRN